MNQEEGWYQLGPNLFLKVSLCNSFLFLVDNDSHYQLKRLFVNHRLLF